MATAQTIAKIDPRDRSGEIRQNQFAHVFFHQMFVQAFLSNQKSDSGED